ncbi:MAG: glycoside hydrolase family 97 catalytic domain-containing protein [Bacteroidetes bacterium]|nr:glycoside hydrolase family 97 catalytic domain-containing protein [Bacteroidota bacterium]
MDPSPLGLIREDSRFVENLEFVSEEKQENVRDQYSLVTGKKLQVSNSYNASILSFQNKDQKQVALEFRAYNDGIAFRYNFTGEAEDVLTITNELTGFDFKDGTFWGQPYDTLSVYTPAYETYYKSFKVGTEAPWNKNGWAFPILVESEGAWMMVSEAGFDGTYGSSHLHAECEQGRYMIKFAEQGEAEGYYENTSSSSLPWSTPWRFIALGETLAQIMETTLPTDLSAPSKIEDTSWIKPGRASWSWWSDNDSPQLYERLVPFVDFAAEMKWEYFLVDANWNHMKNGTMEELLRYAEQKNVGLLLWYNSGGKHNVVTEEPRDLMWDKDARRAEFERISKLGIKGVKVDFFQSDKQEIINQYISILEDAADFKLLVNFHGCTLPKGWRRTWPNLVSMEAVRGEECYIFDPYFPTMAPGNMTILPFTRNAVGPVDYTPGGFSNNTYDHLTTYGFELALTVILETGIMHHADTPGQTMGLPPYAVDFLKTVPVVWEETKFLGGYPGKDVVLARKNGDRWYIAGINGENMEKEISIDLSPLGIVPSTIALIVDGNGARDLQTASITPVDGKVSIRLQPYGGFTGSWE